MVRDIDCLILGYGGVDRIIRVSSLPEKGKTCSIINSDNHKVSYGGNGSNVAACMGRLGCKVLPLMRVGKDFEELGYRHMLVENGVLLDGITIIEDEITSTCHLVEDCNGNHMTMTYPGPMNERYATGDWDESFFLRSKYGVVTPSTKKDVECFVAKCEQYGLPIIFGVRVDNESFPELLFRKLLLSSEIIFMNEVEKLYIEKNLVEIKEMFLSGKAKQVIVTLGANGSDIYHMDGNHIVVNHVDATRCDNVVDTTGAGDSFIAGYLYSFFKGNGLSDCAKFGSCESASVISMKGCTDGALSEEELIAAFIRRKKGEMTDDK